MRGKLHNRRMSRLHGPVFTVFMSPLRRINFYEHRFDASSLNTVLGLSINTKKLFPNNEKIKVPQYDEIDENTERT